MAADITTVPDLTPTERAIANMRAFRKAAGTVQVGDEWLVFAELLRLQDVTAEQAARIVQLDAALADAYAIPGEDAA